MSFPALELAVLPHQPPLSPFRDRLIALVENSVTSIHTRRAYRAGLVAFFAWMETQTAEPGQTRSFTKETVNEYGAALQARGLSSSTINLRLSPIRKLAREMTDNGMLAPEVANAIERVHSIKQRGDRVGNWLHAENVRILLNAPDAGTRKGLRDRAILALLVGCGIRRAELVGLNVGDVQQREGRWTIPDLVGKGGRLRTVPVPASVKERIDDWLRASGITSGRIFRAVNKGDVCSGTGIGDATAIFRLVEKYARAVPDAGKLAPHDLRRTCAKLCREAGGELEQIKMLLGHGSLVTTELYLGTRQDLAHSVNDALGHFMR